MAQIIPFPLWKTEGPTDLDHCWECSRFIEEGEDYIEVPVTAVIKKAICEDCEEHFLSKMTRLVFLTDLTICRA